MVIHSAQINRAKSLRKNMSDTELKFWYRINRNQMGVKFRRQQPIGPYVVDFVCHSLKLVIELDGDQHLFNIEYDNKRTQYIESQGYMIIRIPNAYLTCTGIDDVVHTLYRCINENLDYYEFFVSRYQ
ncbi:MAG: endonuclease domain-containing protein [Alphaproteobacteria bacterium]|nr:endonuclease domain-containing protein [Alphaproteobacteria bacterium]